MAGWTRLMGVCFLWRGMVQADPRSFNNVSDVRLPAKAEAPSPQRLVRMELGVRRAAARRRLRREAQEDAPPDEVSLYTGYGTHYVFAYIGTPPQRVSVIVDTGSHVTAFPCDGCATCGTHTDPYFVMAQSTTFRFVPCSDCAMSSSCASTKRCELHLRYAEGSSWRATEATDRFWVGGEAPGDANAEDLSIDFRFACQTSETGLFVTQLADGIMGMDMHGSTLVDQLVAKDALAEHSFSLCFREEGGVMTLGGTDSGLHQMPMAYTPLSRTRGFYAVGVDRVQIGNETAEIDRRIFNAGRGTIIDSGTTDTYLPSAFRTPFRDAWKRATGRDFDNAARMYGVEEVAAFPVITFSFKEGLRVAMHHTRYMELLADGRRISRIYLDEDEGAILGANFMSGSDVHFDKANARVGFAPAKCGGQADFAL